MNKTLMRIVKLLTHVKNYISGLCFFQAVCNCFSKKFLFLPPFPGISVFKLF